MDIDKLETIDDGIEDKYVIFKVLNNSFGVPVKDVIEFVSMPDNITKVPDMPEMVRGVINLRGKVIPLCDLRILMGIESLPEHYNILIENLKQREKEHMEWINELEKSIIEERDFNLPTDPHKCKFGLWYDEYMKNTENSSYISMFLRSFDTPHKAIHSVADRTKAFVKNGQFDRAMEIVRKTKNNTLKKMVNLFADFYQLIVEEKNKEIAVMTKYNNRIVAFTADSVESVEELFDVAPMPELTSHGKLVKEYGRTGKQKDIMIFDYKNNLEEYYNHKVDE